MPQEITSYSSGDLPPLEMVPTNELEFYFSSLFGAFDGDSDGILEPDEFVSLLQHAARTEDQVRMLVAAAEVNPEGAIEYGQFVPAAISMMLEQQGLLRGESRVSGIEYCETQEERAQGATREELMIPEGSKRTMQVIMGRQILSSID